MVDSQSVSQVGSALRIGPDRQRLGLHDLGGPARQVLLISTLVAAEPSNRRDERRERALQEQGGPAMAMTSENSWAIIIICRKPGPLGPALPSCSRPMNWRHISSNRAPGRASTSIRTSSSPTGRPAWAVFGGTR